MGVRTARIAALGTHAVAPGLGGDETAAVSSTEWEQAAIGKTEHFELPWLGLVARAALPYGDDHQTSPAPPKRGRGFYPMLPVTERSSATVTSSACGCRRPRRPAASCRQKRKSYGEN
jgi:hypothetical protein